MSEKKRINPYTVLGVSDERANEMSAELQTMRRESQDTTELLTLLSKRYDPESIIMGLYLSVVIMEQEGRLLPKGVSCAIVDPTRN